MTALLVTSDLDLELDALIESILGRSLPRLGECRLATGTPIQERSPLPYPTRNRLSIRRLVWTEWTGVELPTSVSIAPLVCGLRLCVTPSHQARVRRGSNGAGMSRVAALIDEGAELITRGLGVLRCSVCDDVLSTHEVGGPCSPPVGVQADPRGERHLRLV